MLKSIKKKQSNSISIGYVLLKKKTADSIEFDDQILIDR